MRFRARLLIASSVLIILLVVALGIGFYRYTSGLFERSAYANLSGLAARMSQQLDNLIRLMDFVTTYLLSNAGFMSSMASLSGLDRGNPRNLLYINEGWQTINATLLSYAITKNFYSVNVLDRNGDFLSSNFNQHWATRSVAGRIDSLGWVAQADGARGRAVILPPYDDPWSSVPGTRVYGLARSAQGPKGGMGYLEVQNRYEDLESLFAVPDEKRLAVVAMTETGQLFFSNQPMSGALVEYYFRSLPSPSRGVSLLRNPVSGAEEILAGSLSSYTGIRVVLAQDRSALIGPLRFSRNITFLIGILIVAVSLAYNLLSARQLTRPLQRLKERMETTELANLPERITLDGTNDEIAALNLSFQRLRERLTEAVQREVAAHSLQLEARLDSLQAQVNPHFIYNVLTVLANRGLQSGDEEIVRICDGLADMLRYSTSTARRSATIAEEIVHVRTYLSLMKQRLEHRLEYRIEVAEGIQGEPIPKIVLQQITENSIAHGFRESQETMLVTVRASATGPASGPGSRWRVEVLDNGQGFSADKLAALAERFRRIDAELAETAEPGDDAGDHRGGRSGHAIGGMGLVNTYARLALFYGEGLEFRLENAPDGGARVVIGAPSRGTGCGSGAPP